MTQCKRCEDKIPENELHHPEGYCSKSCETWHKQEKCKHTIRLKGTQIFDDREGFERKQSIYYCPECKLNWERD